jgi:hypothetical protein
MPRDQVTVEEAYAEALVQLAHLQEQVILGRALITSLRKEVERGSQNAGNAGDAGRDDSPHHFSD